MKELILGKTVDYSVEYNPSILQSIPRTISRDNIQLPHKLPFTGVDIWNAYEVSWLNSKNKPVVAICRIEVPIDSPNLIESKSLKLYLNSLNQTQFFSEEAITATLKTDLTQCAGEEVQVTLVESKEFDTISFGRLNGILLDDLDIEVFDYDIDRNRLITGSSIVCETLVSHLLKSNCLITNQPDWASVLIKYEGPQINHESLLRYIISYRQHNEFHEQCVERIYYDILQACKPIKLTVYARYTRRGGLDINPFRSNFELPYLDERLPRQ